MPSASVPRCRSRVRERDERVGACLERPGVRVERRGDLRGLDVSRETVGAKHESIAGLQLLHEDVGLDAPRISDESRDAVLDRAGMVLGDLTRGAIAHQVRPAITEVRDHETPAVDHARDERGRRARLRRCLGGLQHRGVGLAHRVTEALGDGLRSRRGEESACELVDRGLRGDLAAWPAAHAVGDGHQHEAAILADDEAVLVPVTHATGVASCRGTPQPFFPLTQSFPGTYQIIAAAPRAKDAPDAGSCRATLQAAPRAPVSTS